MAHIFSNDLTMANASDIIISLDIAALDAKRIKDNIETFRTSTINSLVGPGYDTIRNKMSLYQDGFSKIVTICNNLRSNIIAANNSALNAMQGYDELNTEDLPELNERLDKIINTLSILETLVPDYDSKGKFLGTYHTLGSAESINMYKSLKTELEKLIKVLNELIPKLNDARAILDGSETDSNNLVSAVDSVSSSVYI